VVEHRQDTRGEDYRVEIKRNERKRKETSIMGDGNVIETWWSLGLPLPYFPEPATKWMVLVRTGCVGLYEVEKIGNGWYELAIHVLPVLLVLLVLLVLVIFRPCCQQEVVIGESACFVLPVCQEKKGGIIMV
jgi:hypothetical protein